MHARLFLAGIGLVTALAVAIVACGGGASPAPSLNLPTLPPNATAGLPSVSVSLPIGSASIPPLPSGVVVPSGAALPSGIDMTKAKSVQLTAQNNSGATGAAF